MIDYGYLICRDGIEPCLGQDLLRVISKNLNRIVGHVPIRIGIPMLPKQFRTKSSQIALDKPRNRSLGDPSSGSKKQAKTALTCAGILEQRFGPLTGRWYSPP
jgi:hypothetical protein